MLCRECGIRESTGVILILCNECFDEFALLAAEEGKKLIPKYLSTEEEFRENFVKYTKENSENVN